MQGLINVHLLSQGRFAFLMSFSALRGENLILFVCPCCKVFQPCAMWECKKRLRLSTICPLEIRQQTLNILFIHRETGLSSDCFLTVTIPLRTAFLWHFNCFYLSCLYFFFLLCNRLRCIQDDKESSVASC